MKVIFKCGEMINSELLRTAGPASGQSRIEPALILSDIPATTWLQYLYYYNTNMAQDIYYKIIHFKCKTMLHK